ncbi:hypothetical protein BC360_12410 [Ensifer sp. LC163]|nr:hypothetical protein BC360_12410 [Ensifer sp. LC163]OCP24138.1 hypothetical protein BC363_23165 [Ensifer sp. LC384]OCP25629.1 hypothetical protein BC361_17530 [Ensifer sp. LC54]
MILVQMIGGSAEPRIETKVLTILPMEQCEEQAANLNRDVVPPKLTQDGGIIVFERRQCALMMDSELTAAAKRIGN